MPRQVQFLLLVLYTLEQISKSVPSSTLNKLEERCDEEFQSHKSHFSKIRGGNRDGGGVPARGAT